MSETEGRPLECVIAVDHKLDHASLSPGEPHQDGMSDEIPRYLSLERVADITSYSVRTLRDFIKSGDLVASRWGRDYRVTEDELRRFIKSREQAEIPERQRPGTAKPGTRTDEDERSD